MKPEHEDITKARELGRQAYNTENDGLAMMDQELLALIKTSDVRGIKLIAAWRRGFYAARDGE